MLQSLFTGIAVISEITLFTLWVSKAPPNGRAGASRRLRAKKEKRAAERAAKVQGERA